MKQVNLIINHLKSSPNFKNLQKAQSYKKLLLFLPKSFTNGILFMYNKNDTLYFVLSHQLYFMEFKSLQRSDKYRKNFIKLKLNELIGLDKSCECINAQNIKAIVKNQAPLMKQKDTSCLPLYLERSKGKFKNSAKNPKLYKIFEEIRDIICSNQQ